MARQQRDVVNLPADLAEQLRQRAADSGETLDELVADLVRSGIEAQDAVEPELTLAPTVRVRDLGAAVHFYQQLGAEVGHGSRDGDWVQLSLGGGRIGLLAHPPNPDEDTGPGTIELNFEASGPLEEVQERLREAGLTIVRPIGTESFGRQLRVSGPDGLLVKINFLEPDLYA